MTEKPFPRKEIYFHTTKIPLKSNLVAAVQDRTFKLNRNLEEYSEAKWKMENEGWTSSIIPTMVDIESNENRMKIHCGVSSYKYLLGMVKLAQARGESDFRGIVHGLSTEVIPIFSDQTIIFEQRQGKSTQHGVGFYDIPSASQNAEMHYKKAEDKYPGLVKNLFDMDGFPKYHILNAFLGISMDHIGDIFYVGFSRGFEVSLDSQVNGFTHIPLRGEDIMKTSSSENRLIYRLSGLPDLLDSIGMNNPKPDVFGNIPRIAPQTGAFTIVDDCLGTLLSTMYHTNRRNYYESLEALKNRGYKANIVKGSNFKLDDLK